MAMQDGLYKVQFQTPKGSGCGVVLLMSGQLRGGDSMMYYRGTYSQNGDQFSAQVESAAHSHPPGMTSVFGLDRVTITISGKSSGNSAQLTGQAAQAPGLLFQAKLDWLCS